MISEAFQIDDIDRRIIKIIQEKPNSTHTQIAKRVNRSQPTIGLRIKKLEKSGYLKFQAGVNMKYTDLYFARVEFQANNPQEVMEMVKNCPSMINAFRLSGKLNFLIILASFKLENLDKIVNGHFRNNPGVQNVSMELITDVLNDFVVPIDLQSEKCQCKLVDDCFED